MKPRGVKQALSLFIFALVCLQSFAFAGPGLTTYQAKIIRWIGFFFFRF